MKRPGFYQLRSKFGFIELRAEGAHLVVKFVFVHEGDRLRGHGRRLYERAMKFAADKGLRLRSDQSMESGPIRIWDRFVEEGKARFVRSDPVKRWDGHVLSWRTMYYEATIPA